MVFPEREETMETNLRKDLKGEGGKLMGNIKKNLTNILPA